jgi:hypothetical protein
VRTLILTTGLVSAWWAGRFETALWQQTGCANFVSKTLQLAANDSLNWNAIENALRVTPGNEEEK